MATQITDFRKQTFKDIVVTIATNKGYNKAEDTLSYNFDLKGNIKKLRIEGVSGEYIAYFKYERVKGDTRYINYTGITYGEYLEFVREVKVAELIGEKVEIKSARKPAKKTFKKEPLIEPQVGDTLHIGNTYDGTTPCKVIKRTPKQVTVERVLKSALFSTYHTQQILLKLNDRGEWYQGNYYDFIYLYQQPIQQSKESKFYQENPQLKYD